MGVIEVEFVGGPKCGAVVRGLHTLPAVIEQVHTACGHTMTARYVREGGDLPERMPAPRRYHFVPMTC